MAGIQIDGVNNKIDFDDDQDTSISANTDYTLVVEVGGNTLATVTATTFTINDNTTITTADNTDTLSLISTDDDANVGPVLRLFRNSASAVDNDVIGNIIFSGNDTAGNETDYLTFQVNAGDADDGQEDGFMRILMPVASSSTEFVRLSPAEVVFNEGSADLDFRVESNASTKMLFVDANEEHVHIGTGDINAFGNFVVESSADCDVEFFSNVGNGTIGVIELFFTTDGSADHQSIASIVAQQPSGDQAARKGEILLKVSDNGGPTTALTIANNREVSGDLNDTSDENLKKNIEDLGTSTDIIKALKPRKFDWKDESKGADKSGFIAQEVATVLPNAVVGGEYAPDTYYEEGDDIPKKATVGDIKVPGNMGKAINTTAILAHAVKTIQELEARIKTLEDA